MRSVLGRVRARATTAVMSWDPVTRRQAPVLALILTVFFAHYAVWCLITPFFIEDSGISFAFARNIATGLGAVPFAGGERVEAYSNPTWTFLIAALYLFRVDPFFSAKVLGALFGSATLLVAWAIGHEARGAQPEPDRLPGWMRREAQPEGSPVPEWAPLVGTALLAASTQFVLWSASGLENSLFNFLLSLGIWRLSVELRTGSEPGAGRRVPWSALAFFLLTMTRPDGLGYAAVGLFARILGTLRNRQWAALPIWLLVFALPYGAYNAARYEYFAWWFPNTYYAKEKGDTVNLVGWVTGGWKQFKDWAFLYGVVFATPAVLLALLPLTGHNDRWRKWLIGTLLAGFAVVTLWDGRLSPTITVQLSNEASVWWSAHVGRQWNTGAVVFITASAVLLGLLTLARRGWAARGLLWGSFSVGVFFWVWSTGDWMKGFRWGSLVAVPVFTLIGLGVGSLARSFPDPDAPLLQWVLRRTPATRRGWVLTALALSVLGASAYFAHLLDGVSNWVPAVFDGKISFDVSDFHVKPKRGPLLALIAVPLATTLGFILGTLRERAPAEVHTWRGIGVTRSFALSFATIATFALALPNTWKSYEFAKAPETSVNDVHRRANYMGTVGEKLDLDDITLLDVDMGAHMFYTNWHIADMAGLIDVSMARHKYQKSFIDDYIFTEVKPTFAHVHGSWARTTKIPQNPKWKDQYLEITGYPSGKHGYHVGNHIRKDLVARKEYTGPLNAQVDFGDGVTLAGYTLPAPEIAAGGKLYLHTWWIATPRKIGFRVLVFLRDASGNIHSAEMAPAFDWYKAEKWKADEYVEGNWYMPVPPSLPEGDYDLGIVLINNKDGQVMPYLGAAPTPMRYLPGEWVSAGAVHIVTADAALKKASDTLASALKTAGAGDCEAAREVFKNARRHVARNTAWRDAHEPELNEALVACYVKRAASAASPSDSATAIASALRIDPTAPEALSAGRIVADTLFETGNKAMAAGDPQAAYLAFLGTVRADPTRSWARVALETARDQRLGISGKQPEKTEPTTKPAARPLSPVDKLKGVQADMDKAAGAPPEDPEEPAEEPAGGGE